MTVYYTKRNLSKEIVKSYILNCKIDKVIIEQIGSFNKLYKLADKINEINCFIYDDTSLSGLPHREINNLFKLLSKNNVIIIKMH